MTPATEHVVEVEVRGAVVLVTLNRPRVLNALDRALTAELGRVADRLETEASLKVAVTRGAGRAFCVGNDLAETVEFTLAEAEAHAATQAAVLDRWAALPLITIAAVDGFALGGGLMLAACHDLRVAAERASFGLPEITLGWPPGYGIHRLICLLGEARAREVILSGARLDAEGARRIGLVNRVVPPERLLQEALGWGDELASLPGGGIRASKRLLTEIGGPPRGGEPRAFASCLTGDEAQGRIRSFLEERKRK